MYCEVCISVSVFIYNTGVLDMQKHFEMNISKQYDAQLFYISFLVVLNENFTTIPILGLCK